MTAYADSICNVKTCWIPFFLYVLFKVTLTVLLTVFHLHRDSKTVISVILAVHIVLYSRKYLCNILKEASEHVAETDRTFFLVSVTGQSVSCG